MQQIVKVGINTDKSESHGIYRAVCERNGINRQILKVM